AYPEGDGMLLHTDSSFSLGSVRAPSGSGIALEESHWNRRKAVHHRQLLMKWRDREVQAVAQTGAGLRAGRPAPPELHDLGVECERCGEPTTNIQCLYGDYWLCGRCRRLHRGLSTSA